MTRRPVDALTLASCMLLTFGGIAACSGGSGEDDDEPSPPPPPTDPPVSFCADAGFIDAGNHPTKWLLTRQIYQSVYVYSGLSQSCPDYSDEDGWYLQYSTNYFLATWEDNGDGTFRQTEKLCEVEVSSISVEFPPAEQDTIVEDNVINHIPVDNWNLSLQTKEVTEDGQTAQCVEASLTSSLASGKIFTVWGAHLDDPENDKCPMHSDCTEYPDSPDQYDQDEDGKPGVTIKMMIDGEIKAETNVCQRVLFKQEPAIVFKLEDGTYQISGALTEVLNDQSQYAVSGDYAWLLEGKDPEVDWQAATHGTSTFYSMSPLGDDADCNAVIAAVTAKRNQ